MKIHVELSSEEEFIQFSMLMQREKHNLAEVLYNRYKGMYEEASTKLKVLQERIAESPNDSNKYYAMDIDDPFNNFYFSTRVINALREEKILTIGRLLEYTESEILRLPNIAKHSLQNIKDALAEHGLNLKVEENK